MSGEELCHFQSPFSEPSLWQLSFFGVRLGSPSLEVPRSLHQNGELICPTVIRRSSHYNSLEIKAAADNARD